MDFGQTDKLEKKSSGKTYITLKDGESVKVVFYGDPYAFFEIYGDDSRTEYQDQVEGSTYRFKVNCAVIELENGKPVWSRKIWKSSKRAYNAFRKALTKKGEHCWYEISRDGTGTDTAYHVLYEKDLSDHEKDGVSKLKPFEFGKPLSGPADHDEDVPF